ncbi:MAG: TusE/DsrC/DsvC family sulfur relay protein [Gammaproteobacteria bacterium]|nr:TusE/DsrC/DsvC family sulfur relay protein [Gammaproteobacteria bacterium]MCB1926213.1 TusE/DsrC/DsvC family sulfur relay protein [Gammaproteobacteria bacterium]
MTRVKVVMKTSGEPVKRIAVGIQQGNAERILQGQTDRDGVAEFGALRGSGRVFVDGRPQYQGPLDKEILIELWNLTSGAGEGGDGAPSGIGGGSIAYPSMQTRGLMVNGREVLTDSEGYIVHPAEWSDDFVRALAEQDGLVLTDEHWEVIHHLRDFYTRKHVQCTVRDMLKHFRQAWGKEKGSNKYLHQLFPRGGPQKQGNRLAGLLRTKGEH